MSISWHPQNCGGNATFSNCIFWNHKHRQAGTSVRTCITNSMSNPSPYGRSRLSFRKHTPSCIVTTNPVRTGLNPLPKRKICVHSLTYPDGDAYSALTVMVCLNTFFNTWNLQCEFWWAYMQSVPTYKVRNNIMVRDKIFEKWPFHIMCDRLQLPLIQAQDCFPWVPSNSTV